MRFSTRSVLAMVAAYGAVFALLRHGGTIGIVAAFFSGTVISAIIMLARRSDIDLILRAAVGGIIGAYLGVGFLSPLLYDYDHGYGEAAKGDFAGSVVGAIVGWFFASLTAQRPPNPPKLD